MVKPGAGGGALGFVGARPSLHGGADGPARHEGGDLALLEQRPGQQDGQWVMLTFPVPVSVREVRLYNPRFGGEAELVDPRAGGDG